MTTHNVLILKKKSKKINRLEGQFECCKYQRKRKPCGFSAEFCSGNLMIIFSCFE